MRESAKRRFVSLSNAYSRYPRSWVQYTNTSINKWRGDREASSVAGRASVELLRIERHTSGCRDRGSMYGMLGEASL